jgi:hypothetical protein
VTLQVQLVGTGSGRVTSSPAGIDCPGTCAISVPVGTVVTLTGTAAASSHFEGWGGGCSGLSCALTASATTGTIFANFRSSAVNPIQHTLSVTVTGAGSVTSTPPGISCPGACSAPFDDGTSVALTATPSGGSTFVWSGACTGTQSCFVALGADAAVMAAFTPPADACVGLVRTLSDGVPAHPGTTGPAMQCSSADSDGAGNPFVVAQSATSLVTDIFNGSPSALTAVPDVTPAVPLARGFGTFSSTPTAFTAIGPDGATVTSTLLPTGFVNIGQTVTGGSVVVASQCGNSTPAGAKVDWQIVRFDDAAVQVGATAIVAGQECASLTVLADAQNTIFISYETPAGVVGIPAGHFVGRWFDAKGAALTDWFDLGSSQSEVVKLLVRPLIGGGVGLRYNGKWTSMAPSGKAEVDPGPAFEDGKDVRIVEGGKAYLTIPDATTLGTLDILAPSGEVCGTVAEAKVNQASTQNPEVFSVGKDGTLLELQLANDCSLTYWPHLLQ